MLTIAPEILLTHEEKDVFYKFTNPNCEMDLVDAMCLWEAVVDIEFTGWAKVKNKPGFERYDASTHDLSDMTSLERAINDWHSDVGSFEMRTAVAGWVRTLQIAWQVAGEVYGYEECFDYEFCPWFLKHCIDHNDMTVRRDWLQQVRRIDETQLLDLMDSGGWRLVHTGNIMCLKSAGKFDCDYDAWLHVLERGVKNRSPLHQKALRRLQSSGSREYEKIHAVAYAAFKVDLNEVIRQPT